MCLARGCVTGELQLKLPATVLVDCEWLDVASGEQFTRSYHHIANHGRWGSKATPVTEEMYHALAKENSGEWLGVRSAEGIHTPNITVWIESGRG